MPGGMLGLEYKGRVFLISLGGETHVVKLHLIHAGLGSLLRQGDVVFLNLGLGGIGPYQLSVFAPSLAGLAGLHRQLRMRNHQPLVAKDSDSSDGMHALRMKEMGELREVMNRNMVCAGQRVSEGNVDASIAIFHIENHGISAQLPPLAD